MNEWLDQFTRFFPPTDQILEMEPEELGPFVLRYMTIQNAMTNRFNFAQFLPGGGEISSSFMEAWSWLEREGFIAHRAQDRVRPGLLRYSEGSQGRRRRGFRRVPQG